MNLPQIKPYEERAMNIVITVINQAKEKIGMRQSLFELAQTAAFTWERNKVSLRRIEQSVAYSAEELIIDTIENTWRLTDVFMYHLKYIGGSEDEITHYYYFEVIFSQPTAAYPIPQATASVYFRVEDKYSKFRDVAGTGAPSIYFRIEGHHTDHDVRFVALNPDWLLAVIKMKIKFFDRLETLRLF